MPTNVRSVTFDLDLLLNMFQYAGRVFEITSTEIPKDAVVVKVMHDPSRGKLILILQSNDFTPILHVPSLKGTKLTIPEIKAPEVKLIKAPEVKLIKTPEGEGSIVEGEVIEVDPLFVAGEEADA